MMKLKYGSLKSCHVLHLQGKAEARGREEKGTGTLKPEPLFALSVMVIIFELVQIWSITYNQENSYLYNKHGNIPEVIFTIKFMQLPDIIFILNYAYILLNR